RGPMAIAAWLASFGLAQYAELFRANDIDLEAARLLTDADLKELGVSLGHRRKLLAAIADLVAVPAEARPSEVAATATPAEAERPSAGPHRHRHRPRGGRRVDRGSRRPRTRGGGRHPEPGGAAAGRGAARWPGGGGDHPAPCWRRLRVRGSRRAGAERHRDAG